VKPLFFCLVRFSREISNQLLALKARELVGYCLLGSYNQVLEWMFQNTNDLQNKKTEDKDKKSLSSVSVPGAGIEPAQNCFYWCLRPARLPVPPSGHLNNLVDKLDCENSYFFKLLFPIHGIYSRLLITNHRLLYPCLLLTTYFFLPL
jgi:hypothetical protein